MLAPRPGGARASIAVMPVWRAEESRARAAMDGGGWGIVTIRCLADGMEAAVAARRARDADIVSIITRF